MDSYSLPVHDCSLINLSLFTAPFCYQQHQEFSSSCYCGDWLVVLSVLADFYLSQDEPEKGPMVLLATTAFTWVVKGARVASQTDSVATELCHHSIAEV